MNLNQNFLGVDFNRPIQARFPLTNMMILIIWLLFSYIATKVAKYLDEKLDG